MTSLLTDIKQVGAATAYYVPLADLRHNDVSVINTAGGLLAYRTDLGRFSTLAWASAPANGAQSRFSTLVASAGAGLLKDMGRSVVSSNRTFRKVQLVVPAALAGSTFGVAGDVNTAGSDYLTGYIEIGVETGVFAKVAKYGR